MWIFSLCNWIDWGKRTCDAGDESIESALNEDETLCMDKVYDALDWFKKAVVETREIEVDYNIYVCMFSFVFFNFW